MFLFGDALLMGKELDSFWIEWAGLFTRDIRDCCLESLFDDVSFLRLLYASDFGLVLFGLILIW